MRGGLLTIGSYFYYYSLQTYLDLLFREGLVQKKWYKQGKTKKEQKENKGNNFGANCWASGGAGMLTTKRKFNLFVDMIWNCSYLTG